MEYCTGVWDMALPSAGIQYVTLAAGAAARYSKRWIDDLLIRFRESIPHATNSRIVSADRAAFDFV